MSGCRRQPRHVRVRRQAGCSVPFRRRMVGGQGHLRSHRAGPHPRCRGPSGEVTRWTSRRSTPCELSSAPNSWRPSGQGRHAGAPGNKGAGVRPLYTDKRAATRLLRGCTGSRRLAIRGRPSPGDRWHRRCPSKSADAHLRLRKPPPGCGRGAVDGAMTSVGSSSATSGESRSPLMSAASKRSISAKPARSRRT